MKINHRHGAELSISNQGFEFIFVEIDNYHQIGKAYLEIGITVKNGKNFHILDGGGNTDEAIRLVNKAFAYAFSIATLATTGEKRWK